MFGYRMQLLNVGRLNWLNQKALKPVGCITTLTIPLGPLAGLVGVDLSRRYLPTRYTLCRGEKTLKNIALAVHRG